MINIEEQHKYLDSFKLSPTEGNTDIHSFNSKEGKLNNTVIKDSPTNELTHEIIAKFDKLLNKEEYYNFQERAYKLNKALTSIANSQNLNVSSFSSTGSTPENNKILNSHIDISPNKLLKMLDELVKEKELQDKGENSTREISSGKIESNDNLNCSFTESSSEDDKSSPQNLRKNQLVTSASPSTADNFTKKKKKLFKYLYNYELLYKTILFEKSFNRIDMESPSNSSSSKSKVHLDDKKICEELGMNFGMLSNLSKNKKFSTNGSDCDSSLTSSILKSQKDKSFRFENGTSTPSINKFFFEEKEFQSRFSNQRRRSMKEESKIMIDRNSELINNRRRSDFLHGLSQPNQIQSRFMACDNVSNADESFVSKFDFSINDDGNKDEGFTNFKSNNVTNQILPNYQKRSSVFKEKNERQYFLSNIYENEEYNSKYDISKQTSKNGGK